MTGLLAPMGLWILLTQQEEFIHILQDYNVKTFRRTREGSFWPLAFKIPDVSCDL